MSNFTASNNEKIFSANFIVIAICFAIALFGFGYVLVQLPEITPEQIETVPKSEDFIRETQQSFYLENTRILTPSEAVSTLSNIQRIEQYSSEGFWMVDWELFKPRLSNYEYITQYSTVFATFYGPTNRLLALSFGTAGLCKVGIRYRIDFYCDEYNMNPNLAIAHILKNIQFLYQQKLRNDINFMVLSPRQLPLQKVRELFEKRLPLGPILSASNMTPPALAIEQRIEKNTHTSKI